MTIASRRVAYAADDSSGILNKRPQNSQYENCCDSVSQAAEVGRL